MAERLVLDPIDPVILVVEGPTEGNFVRRILAPHQRRCGVIAAPSIVGKVKTANRGLSGQAVRGGSPYADWRCDIRIADITKPSSREPDPWLPQSREYAGCH